MGGVLIKAVRVVQDLSVQTILRDKSFRRRSFEEAQIKEYNLNLLEDKEVVYTLIREMVYEKFGRYYVAVQNRQGISKILIVSLMAMSAASQTVGDIAERALFAKEELEAQTLAERLLTAQTYYGKGD